MRKSLRLTLMGAASGVALLMAAPTSAAIIGGVEIDPENFVITRADTWESIVTGPGQELSGFGRVLSLNHDNTFCSGCELTFTFEDYIVKEINEDGTEIAFEGGIVRFYVDHSPDFNGNPSWENASNGDLWLELAGMEFFDERTGMTGTLIGRGVGFNTSQPTGFGDGRLQLVLNMDAIATEFFMDFEQPFIFTSDFQNVGLGTDDFPITGAATMTARIPEPATLGLLGAGLLGLGLMRRRKAA